MARNPNWTFNDTLLAMALYLRIGYGKIGSTNPEIIALSRLIHRSPNAVALKMANLADYDPEVRNRNRKGLSNGSKLDGQVWNKYYGRWEELAYKAAEIKASLAHQPIGYDIQQNQDFIIAEGSSREQTVKARVGQDFFRKAVLNAYRHQCCITGIAHEGLLIASHIKPWVKSDDETEKANPSNGLCLNPLHDKAFDKGLITVSKDYRIHISSQLKKSMMDETTKSWLMSYEKSEIMLPEKYIPQPQFLEYHNDEIFQK